MQIVGLIGILFFIGFLIVLLGEPWLASPPPDRIDRASGYESAEVKSDLLGTRGTAITDLRPSGTALIDDERIDVVSESDWIARGTTVKVVSTEGNRHIVRSIADEEAGDD